MQLELEEPKTHGLSRDELIEEFIREKQRYQESYSRVRELSAAIADIAASGQRDGNTAYVQSSKGQRLKVTFGETASYDPNQMFTVADLLGKDVFDGLFRTKVEFQAQKRALTMFLKTVSADERIETAKTLIRDAIRTEDKSPYVQVVEKE